ncbi:ACP phosphodiesterase [Halotalea alkalilenta]|uniref:acyl carrier protein phosphodiesterase n=1 Tax=Halotalea alkalilenta TaxID=376489 RepID=UPI000488ED30|nr:ACP phosphodiesterase [Halotalea alkalilenta]
MNFIGHALLAASGSDDFLFGNLVADGIKGAELGHLPAEVERGVRMHRRVDATIDHHPEVRALLEIIPERRVAGVALDIVWDHFLARDRLDPGLAARCYRLLSSRALPERQAPLLEALVAGRWLERYADFAFTLGAIEGVGRRLSGPNRLAALSPWLSEHYPLLQSTYARLWPDLERRLSSA